MAKPSVEVFYDCSSPWTYLLFHNLGPALAGLDVAIAWRPILVGGIFNAVNPSVYASRDNPVLPKARYMKKDLADWARASGLKIVFPPTVFPVNSVKAMRACLWAETQGKQVALAREVFELYWGEDKDIAQDDILAEAAARAGLDAKALASATADPIHKAALKANTDEAIARGAFGSPTIFVGGSDMYFGNDRLPLIRAAVERKGA